MPCVLKRRYGPQIRSGSGTLPTWAPSESITLTWPYVSPDLTLIVRAPDLGDEFELSVKRTDNTSRGGTINYFRDTDWPKTKLLKLGFSGLCDTDVDDFLEFLTSSVGDEIGLLDWLGQQWRGIILDPDGNVIDSGIEDDHMMNFVFRGARV